MDKTAPAWPASIVATGLALASYPVAVEEREIRSFANDLYLRVDWNWALSDDKTICHGWKPESGFLQYHWAPHKFSGMLWELMRGCRWVSDGLRSAGFEGGWLSARVPQRMPGKGS